MRRIVQRIRASGAGMVLSALMLGVASTGPVTRAATPTTPLFDFDIRAQDLDSALQLAALRANQRLLYRTELVFGRRSADLRGTMTIEEALASLLTGSGLAVRKTTRNVLLIEAPSNGVVAAAAESGRPDTAPAPAAATPPRLLQEIIVTARRREEQLAEVPIAVTALDRDSLDSRNIDNMQRLGPAVPNLMVSGGGISGPSNGFFRIRGIPGVAVYVDGVVKSGSQGLLLDVVELDRIEVLRGPQGTLFGKNAIGGAIQFISQRPREEAGARVRTTVGSNDRSDLIANIDIPFDERLLSKLTAARLYKGGFVRSDVNGERYGSAENLLGRAMLQWFPAEETSLLVTAEKTSWSSNGQAEVIWGLSAPAYTQAGYDVSNATHAYGARHEFRNTMDMTGEAAFQETFNYALDITHQLSPAFSLRSVTGGRSLRYGNHNDLDGTLYDIFQQWLYNEREEFSQELQLLLTTQRLSGTAGLYYFSYDQRSALNGYVQRELIGPDYAPGDPLPAGWSNDLNRDFGEGVAAFSEFSYELTNRWALTAGLRYTSESFKGQTLQPASLLGVYPEALTHSVADRGILRAGRRTFHAVTPRLSAQYRWNPDWMAYASFSEGFGAGGFNTRYNGGLPNDGFIPYDPETLRNFEAGLRAQTLSGRLRVNGALFFGIWEDIQVGEEITPAIVTTTNAGSAKIRGAELEGEVALLRDLTLYLSHAWLDARYTNVGRATSLELNSRLAYAPQTSWSLGAQYDRKTRRGAFRLRGDYAWRDATVSTPDVTRQVLQPSLGLLNGSLGYFADSGRWSVTVAGTNLTDEFYQLGGFKVPVPAYTLDMGTVGRPREFSVSVSLTFD